MPPRNGVAIGTEAIGTEGVTADPTARAEDQAWVPRDAPPSWSLEAEARLAWDRVAVHPAGDLAVEARPAEGVRKTAWRGSRAS